MSTLGKVSLAMFVAGEAAILLAAGLDAWPLLVAWGLGALVVLLGARLFHGRLERAVLSGLLMPACVLLVFEGGLFFLPAAVTLFVATVRDGHQTRHFRVRHGR